MKEIKAFQCDYCKKRFIKRKTCEKHEKIFCTKNPLNTGICRDCKYLEYHCAIPEDNMLIGFKPAFCTKLNRYFCSPKQMQITAKYIHRQCGEGGYMFYGQFPPEQFPTSCEFEEFGLQNRQWPLSHHPVFELEFAEEQILNDMVQNIIKERVK